jgi:predicted nucleotide-binding protein
VIGEMFWFATKLGRSRVCALRSGDVEVPSDFSGVVYTNVDDRGAWLWWFDLKANRECGNQTK